MSKLLLVLALVALMVSVAGCTSPPNSADNAGDKNALAVEDVWFEGTQVATQALRKEGVREALASGLYSREIDEVGYVPWSGPILSTAH